MDKITVAYGDKVVIKDFSWKIRKGENWGVTGPNGAGKSTLLSLIAGDHLQAYANRVKLFGRQRGTGETIWEIKKRMGLVSSAFELRYDRPVTALDAVVSGFFDSVGLFRLAGGHQIRQARNWLDRLDMGHLKHCPVNQLSDGERRRVLLARALVKEPELLVFDEPCQGLDPWMRNAFLDLVEKVGKNGSPQILYVTHYADELPGCLHRFLTFIPDPVRRRASPGASPETSRAKIRRKPAAESCLPARFPRRLSGWPKSC